MVESTRLADLKHGEENSRKNSKATVEGVAIAVFVAFTGLWHYGFAIGAVNSAYVPITKFVKEQYESRFERNVTSEFVEAIWVTSSAIFPIGGLFGSFLVGPLVRRFGRLNSILIGHVTVIILSLLMGLSSVFGAPELIIIGRFGLGLMSGSIGTGVVPMYLTEISPLHIRGVFGSMVGAGISISIFLANVAGLPEALGNDSLWPLLLALTGLPSFLFIIFYKCIPESPRKLFMEDGNEKASVKVLKLMNGNNNVDKIVEEMREEKIRASSQTQVTVLALLRSRSLRRSLIAAVGVASAQQITGVNGVYFNMNNAFMNAGVSPVHAPYFSVGVTGIAFLMNALSMYCSEKFGRKPLLLICYLSEAFFLLMLTIFTEMQQMVQVMSYLAVISSLGFVLAFSLAGGTVTHAVMAELFDQTSRSAGLTISTATLWCSFITCVVVTPYMLNAIRGYAFLPFCILAVLYSIFIAVRVPETKNRTFSNIISSNQQSKTSKF